MRLLLNTPSAEKGSESIDSADSSHIILSDRSHCRGFMSVLAILFSITAAFASISPEVERAELMADFEAHMQGMHDHMPGERGICLTG